MSITHSTGYYNNDIVVEDGNTKIVIDISDGRKVYCQGYFADKDHAKEIFELVDSVSNDVDDSMEFRKQMVKEYFADVLEEIQEEQTYEG